ncbi:hypothetical protein ACFQ0M_05630 [Kitasatospora aburaviensis]
MVAAICLSAVAGCAGPVGPGGPSATAGAGATPAGAATEAGAGAGQAADHGAPRPPAVPLTLPGLARAEEESSSEAVARQQAAVRAGLATARRWGLERLPAQAPQRPVVRPELKPAQGVKLAPGRPRWCTGSPPTRRSSS